MVKDARAIANPTLATFKNRGLHIAASPSQRFPREGSLPEEPILAATNKSVNGWVK
jgi:hypothetical protein